MRSQSIQFNAEKPKFLQQLGQIAAQSPAPSLSQKRPEKRRDMDESDLPQVFDLAASGISEKEASNYLKRQAGIPLNEAAPSKESLELSTPVEALRYNPKAKLTEPSSTENQPQKKKKKLAKSIKNTSLLSFGDQE